MTTMTATTTTTTTIACCPSCGSSLPQLPPVHESHAALLRAQRQVEDLQAQVRLLNEKAAAAVDRWADYEDELSRLRAASVTTNHTASASTSSTNGAAAATIPGAGHGHTTTTTASSPRSSFLPSGAASRLSQLLSPRRSLANLTSGRNRNSVDHGTSTPLKPLPHPHSNSRPQGLRQAAHITSSSARTPSPSLSPSPSPSPSPNPHQQQQHQHQQQQTEGGAGAGARTTRDLLAALGREKELRRAAEGRLNDTSREVEELSVSLFEQANEMVAQERRARAKLEERVAQLETRDLEKRDRLDRLEGALTRIERVRALLGGGAED